MAKYFKHVRVEVGKLTAIIGKLPTRADDLVEQAANNIAKRAKESMVSGGSPHVPATPGEPPHRETGELAAGIHVEKPRELLRYVGDSVEYGIYMEFGTGRRTIWPGGGSPIAGVYPHPWLLPATEAERETFVGSFRTLFR